MEDLSNEYLAKIDGMAQEVLEQVLSESKNYGDAKRSLNNLKIMAKSHFKKEHLLVIYEQASKKLEEKINATLIKKWRKGGIAMFKILNDLKTSLKNHPWGWKEHLPYLLILSMSLIALILGILSMILS